MSALLPLDRLLALAPGRHYFASPDSGCWLMVGRDLRTVERWEIVPPAASLTLAWGAGGCRVQYCGGLLAVGPGDWMWIDAGLAHAGENMPGSDFLTLFVPDSLVEAAALHLLPIGAASHRAPPDLARLLVRLAALMLEGRAGLAVEQPILDGLLDWVGTCFPPQAAVPPAAQLMVRAAAMLRNRPAHRIDALAASLGLPAPVFSRRFRAFHRVSAQQYRKHVRLAAATRALGRGSSILCAAHEAGFADSAHLSRTFRAQYGVSPSAWARAVAAEAPVRQMRSSTTGPHPLASASASA